MAIQRIIPDSGRGAESCILAMAVAFVLALQLPLFPSEAPMEGAGTPVDTVDARVLAYTPHEPILIEDDADFELQGWPGKGTRNDPYVIEGLDIDGLGFQVPICIRGTTAYFEVRGCHIYNGLGGGIYLENVENGAISDNLCVDNNHWGIRLRASSHCNVTNNTCTGNFGLRDNRASGIFIDDTDWTSVMNNSCSANRGNGISCGNSEGTVISQNNCSGNLNFMDYSGSSSGLSLLNDLTITVTDNQCFDNANSDFLARVTTLGNMSWNRLRYMDVEGSTMCNIGHNLCTKLELYLSDRNDVNNNTCTSGIWLSGTSIYGGCNENLIADNNCSNSINGNGIRTWVSSGTGNISGGNTIVRNDLSKNYIGLFLDESDWNTVAENNCSYCRFGIKMDGADRNTITDEAIVNDLEYGILMSESNYNKLRDCSMVFCGIGISGDEAINWATHDIDTSNTVNGLPVYYAKGLIAGTVPDGFGQVILAASKNVVVDGVSVSNASVGITVGHCTYVTVADSTSSGNLLHGIFLAYSSNCTVEGNTCLWNGINGTDLIFSQDIVVADNLCAHNGKSGIGQAWCRRSIVADNTCEHNMENGITGFRSWWGSYARNNCSLNSNQGLRVDSSSYCYVWGNTFLENVGYGMVLTQSIQYGMATPHLNTYNTVWDNRFFWNNLGGAQALGGGDYNRWNISTGGNWWSDWQSPDADGDGIVDEPYYLVAGVDYLPLTDSYIIPEPSPVLLTSILMLVIAFVCAWTKRRSRTPDKD